eukprot:CAMPEP_0115870476 /NCGR_PEP_ID=MMETSP0287-20121206/22346_1 /TAXON_ID=412157 /ORGANISM="Chrysochromulina rotalis, Strain UIO044" /LENGTH=83 /DNA_ID=CAMNT_0003325199 /DNA_START=489 /DNA_END=740 /DNA_ORIENTATION=+
MDPVTCIDAVRRRFDPGEEPLDHSTVIGGDGVWALCPTDHAHGQCSGCGWQLGEAGVRAMARCGAQRTYVEPPSAFVRKQILQ